MKSFHTEHMPIQGEIEALSQRRVFVVEKVNEFETSFDEFENPLFADCISGFDQIAWDVLNLGKESSEKLLSTISQLNQRKISLAHLRYYSESSAETKQLREWLVDHFEHMVVNIQKNCLDADGASMDVYSDTKLNEIYGNLKDFLILLDDTYGIIQAFKRKYLLDEDLTTCYLDGYSGTNALANAASPASPAEAVPGGTVRLSNDITYNKETYEFTRNDTEEISYSIHGYPKKIALMELLVNNPNPSQYIGYQSFVVALGLVSPRPGYLDTRESTLFREKKTLLRSIASTLRLPNNTSFIETKKGFRISLSG